MIDEKRFNELAKYLYELGDYYNEQCLEAAVMIEELKAELGRMTRRADAAVRDIMCSDHCDVCKHNRGDVAECDASDFECGDCKSDNCVCRHCQDEDKWEWRGVTE